MFGRGIERVEMSGTGRTFSFRSWLHNAWVVAFRLRECLLGGSFYEEHAFEAALLYQIK